MPKKITTEEFLFFVLTILLRYDMMSFNAVLINLSCEKKNSKKLFDILHVDSHFLSKNFHLIFQRVGADIINIRMRKFLKKKDEKFWVRINNL